VIRFDPVSRGEADSSDNNLSIAHLHSFPDVVTHVTELESAKTG